MTSALPAPTADRDRAKRDFAEHGYCLIADAMSPAETRAVRQRLVAVALEEAGSGRAYIDAGCANQRVWTLLNKGSVFCDLAAHPLALEMMDHILGRPRDPWAPGDKLPQYLLGSITANIAGPGGEPMHLHQDQYYVPFPWPPFPLVVNIAWLLDDTTVANGATRIVPGSQTLDARPDAGAEARTVSAEGPAGAALIFDGRLWHGTGGNSTAEQKRHVVLACYCKPWIRTQENHIASTDPAVVARATPALRRLMGFDSHGGLGMINGLPPTQTQPAAHHQTP